MPARSALVPRHAPVGEGRKFNIVGDIATLVLGSADTGGTYEMYDVVSPVGGGSPPHVHRREEESFFILDGEVEFSVAGKKIRCGPGDALFGPRDVPHFFRNVGTKPARLLITVSPATLEPFFTEVDRLMCSGPANPQKLVEIAARYGIEILSPLR
jgi:quercetin dioxygenase-like cupin family protein